MSDAIPTKVRAGPMHGCARQVEVGPTPLPPCERSCLCDCNVDRPGNSAPCPAPSLTDRLPTARKNGLGFLL